MRLLTWAAGLGLGLLVAASAVRAAEQPPITIGFDIEETGSLAVNGRASLLAYKIWQQHVNAMAACSAGQVKFVYYDDQSNPSLVPGIVTKLLDIDHVDILLGENGTNLLAPAMPIVMQRNLTFLGLFGLDVNKDFHYKNYFSMIPSGGPNPAEGLRRILFQAGRDAEPKAEDHRDGRRRCGFRHSCAGRRAGAGEEGRPEDRL